MKDVGNVCIAMCKWGLFFIPKLKGLNAHFIGVLENTIDTQKTACNRV